MRHREATYAEIVRVSRELLASGSELSLRAVAAGMGVTAPALYRYVSNYQELVDLVAFEIDKAVTDTYREATERFPDDDPAAKLVVACVLFRNWGLQHRSEFGLVFANPVAATSYSRRELMTQWCSGLFMNGLLVQAWRKYDFGYPTPEELGPELVAILSDPLMPIDPADIPEGEPGLLWLFNSGWAALYGVVTLEVFGHLDPRVVESGAMFVQTIREWIRRLMPDEYDRLDALVVAELRQARSAQP
ncbi:TetR/AcrR family transcriptional regulator [Nocardioides speluncae]|uniref:TetR/AcrR family transcriptional regulator n=1 Tax=Nocardioides speluncae TaxID=2670337 RepID=UPI000D687E16|nr:TetR/AcrR family transcriptional regulator [Nocardioides speluncae]